MSVRLKLLGRFEAHRGEDRLTVSSRKGEGLLALLALAPGQVLSRDEICALLWSDRGEAQARASLRQELAGLRKALGGDVITVEGECVGLSSEAIDTDAMRLDRSDMDSTFDLYRGELLQGTTIRDPAFNDWLRDNRERLMRRAVDVAAEATDTAVSQSDWQTTVTNAERLLELDPANETGHQALMRAYAAAGNTRRAVEQFEQCKQRLRREQEVEPGPETLALLEEINAGSVESAPGRARSATSDVLSRPAVLVLPFNNLSDDSEQAYFAAGITEDIITALSYWRWFPVIGPNAIGGDASNLDALTAAAGVNARYVLHGSVRRDADRVRIAVQLIDGETAHNVWAQRFERPFSDVFALQDEISECVVAQLEPQLEKAEQRRSLVKRARDLTAWDYILQAAQAERDGGPGYGTHEANEKIRALLLRALEYQPPAAMALAMLGRTYWRDSIMGWSDRDTSLRLAVEHSRESIDRDPESSLGHAVYSTAVLFGLGDVPVALEHSAEAVRLNPSAPVARHVRACSLEFSGVPEEAVTHLEALFRLDPNYVATAAALADLTMCKLMLQRYDEAEEAARRCKSLAPDYVRGQHRYIAALAYAGKQADAEAALAELFAMQPDFSLAYIENTYPFARKEHHEILVEGLRMAGWQP